LVTPQVVTRPHTGISDRFRPRVHRESLLTIVNERRELLALFNYIGLFRERAYISGMYIFGLKAGEGLIETRKMALIR
jgi:hypothetical protein